MVDVKQKGSQFERDAVNLLKALIPKSDWKRMPTSGAMGTILQEPLLGGDLKGRIEGLPVEFRGEAKVGYGGAKQMALKREWLEKIKTEADKTYSIPFVIGKFSGSRSTVKEFVVLDIETFALLLNTINDMYEELTELYDDKQRLEAN